MRVVVQRVNKAQVKVNQTVSGKIQKGLVVLAGIEDADTMEDINWLSRKICNLRIFEDNSGVMNLSLRDIEGDILLVSQFTLFASTKKGNRPSYIKASKPDKAVPLYEALIQQLAAETGKMPKTGKFGEMMSVDLINDGPVTIIIDTKNKE
jgi:D-aminoacyl-tRNA deacylase